MPRHDHVSRTTMQDRVRLAAAAGLCALLAGGGTAMAQEAAPASGAAVGSAPVPAPAPAPAPAASATTAPGDETITAAGLQSRVGKEKAGRIEAHIARLHTTLRITPAQEPLWQSFASVMRQNVVQMDAVYAKRESGYGAMNAVQDLISYGEVEEANARNVQMLLPPFRSLYDSFSADQKKIADSTFLRYTDKAVKKPG